MTRYVRALLAASLFLAGSACSKKDPLSNTDPRGESRRAVRLEVETPRTLALEFGDSSNISVRAVFADDGTPVLDREIAFSFAGNPGGSNLTALTLRTDSGGRVRNQVLAGLTRTSFSIVVSTADAEDASITVNVDGVYTGRLRAQYTYDGAFPLGAISTRIHPNAPSCSALDLENLPANEGLLIAPGPTSYVVFDDLEEGARYTVTAVAQSVSGSDVARGCVEAPAIVGRSLVTAIVPLSLGDVSLVGDYDFRTQVALSEALPGEAGATVSLISSILEDPASYLADQVYAAAQTQLGLSQGGVEALVLLYDALNDNVTFPDTDGDGKVLDDAVTQQIEAFAPPWVINTIQVGADLTQLLTNFTVGGPLEITNAVETGEGAYGLTGTWQWSDFLFRWRLNQGCDIANACCGRQRFSGEELGVVPVGAPFTGTATRTETPDVLEYDIAINEHRLELQYGQLIIAAINHIVLPELTGQNSMECALESAIGCSDAAAGTFSCGTTTPGCGCARFGEWLAGTLNLGDPAAGEALCGVAIDLGVEQIEAQLASLTTTGSDDFFVTADIVGLLADEDRDLQTDELNGGNSGAFHIQGESSAFSAGMYGQLERELCVADAGCGASETCQPKLDVLDDCEGRLVCVSKFGDGGAMASCSAADQCAGGACVNSRCFQACEGDSDCPGTMSCGADAASIAVSDTVDLVASACGM